MQVPAAACCSISAAKYLFEVKCVTDSAMVRCKKKSKSSARDVFMTAQAALLRSEKPDIDDERLQEQLQNLWKKWLLDQGLTDVVEEVEPVQGDTIEKVEVEISKENLGFAKTRGKAFFPAVRHPLQGCQDRIKVSVVCPIFKTPKDFSTYQVVFCKTGDSAIVGVSSWLPYSEVLGEELLADVKTNRGSFGEAFKELLSIVKRVNGEASGSAGHGNLVISAPRVLGAVSKKKLFEEELFNQRAFAGKMFEEGGKWKCKNCPGFNEESLLRAKRHARECGDRPKAARVRSKMPRYPCSAENCDKVFVLLSDLNVHYRLDHPQRRLYRCPPCQATFSAWKSLSRHRREHHLDDAPKYGCGVCAYTSSRLSNMKRHRESSHSLLLQPFDGEASTAEPGEEEEGTGEVQVADENNVEEEVVDDSDSEEANEEAEFSLMQWMSQRPEIMRVQLLIDAMWSRKETLSDYELIRLASLQQQRHALLTHAISCGEFDGEATPKKSKRAPKRISESEDGARPRRSIRLRQSSEEVSESKKDPVMETEAHVDGMEMGMVGEQGTSAKAGNHKF